MKKELTKKDIIGFCTNWNMKKFFFKNWDKLDQVKFKSAPSYTGKTRREIVQAKVDALVQERENKRLCL